MQSLFNLPQGSYLLSHSVGCLPKLAETHLQHNYLDSWRELGGDAWPKWLDILQGFNQQLGELLGGNAEDFCPQANVSSGLCKYLQSLPELPHSRQNTVLMHATAFPSMGFVVQALGRQGYQLKLIDSKLDATDVDVWQQHLTADVAGVVITHVHSNTGVLSPVAKITQLCRSRDGKQQGNGQEIKVIVDVAQSVGVVPIALNAWQADVVLGSCVKWLCGGPGAGFMWLNPQHVAQLKPVDVGWFSHEDPFEFDIEHFSYAKGAMRFMGGTPSVAAFAMAQGSIKQIQQLGVGSIQVHNHELKKIVLDGARPHLTQDIDLATTGGTLCLSLGEKQAARLEQQMRQANCLFDRRENTLRLSFHIYNTPEQAEQVAELLHGW
jgi:kynureninase